jgi:HlyD family secretion protein
LNRRLLVVAAVIIAVIALPLVQARLRGGAAVEVQVEKLEPRTIRSSVLASGRLIHEEQVKLSSEEIGKVTAIYVREGDLVKKGELVLQIDDQRYRAAVEQNEAAERVQQIAIERQQLQVENLRTQWERTRGLHDRKLIDDDRFTTATNQLKIAEVDLQSSRATLSQVRAQLDQAKDHLAKTSTYSPIDGLVTTVDIKVGETAISSSTNIPGSNLMTIANPDSILTEVNVDEADIANVRVGQPAKVYAIAYPNLPVEGTVESIAVTAKVAEGQQGRSFAVKIKLQDSGEITLRPGMTCRAEIFAASKDKVLAAPIQAIRVEEDLALKQTHRYVFVDRGSRAARLEVQTGLSDDTYQELTSGVTSGEDIIIGPDRVLRALKDGDRVVLQKK